MKNNKLYEFVLLGFIIILISIFYFNRRVEGFAPWVWYRDEYILMPVVITLFFAAPIIFMIYHIILRNMNKIFN